MKLSKLASFVIVTIALFVGHSSAHAVGPPDGFEAIFNGNNLDGWFGWNPHESEKLTGEKKSKNLTSQRAAFGDHWRVENGELVNDGDGPYATTVQSFGDLELRLEYKTVAGADSGVYLRGTPQVQIWDWNQKFDPQRPNRKPHLGSGGLFNNTPGNPGRDPMVLADRPFGQWNQLWIRQVGDRTWVWLNEKLVVDGTAMENYWDRSQPLPTRGPIMLQTHGGEIRWRNIFVRKIDDAEANQFLADADAAANSQRLEQALTLHASFSKTLDAEFSRGDRTCYVKKGKLLHRARPNQDARIVSGAGGGTRGALHFPHKSGYRPAFRDQGVLGYNGKDWNATVSLWLRLNPDQDLEPGYCDPVQIIGDNSKKGFIFLEFSKDETPRFFRYAIRPLFQIWNPNDVSWADIPFAKRPMVQVQRPPFSRDVWTHVAFTLQSINNRQRAPTGSLYLNGKLQGAIEDWDLTIDWNSDDVLLVLGAAYVGYMKNLAVFNRALTADEIKTIHGMADDLGRLYSGHN